MLIHEMIVKDLERETNEGFNLNTLFPFTNDNLRRKKLKKEKIRINLTNKTRFPRLLSKLSLDIN